MLYVGIKDNEPIVIHNIWSLRLRDSAGKQYRHFIGKATITTLEPAKGMKDFDKDTNILNRVTGIVVL